MHPSVHARTNPDKPAFIMAYSGETVTYGELDARSNQGAHLFRSLGIGPGDPIAIFMENSARYGFVFAKRGLNPEAASSWFLPHLVGVQTALEWCYTGRLFGSDEARDRGLVRSTHEPEDLLPAARAIAREIADNTAPVSIALTRQLIWRMAGAAHPMEAHRADSRGIQARGRSGDAREGVTSFLEKRPPNYPDKVSSDLPDIWPHWTAPTFT